MTKTADNKLISHNNDCEDFNNTLKNIKQKIISASDKPHVSVKKQLDILEQLSKFDFGKFLLQHQGINGYWTHYMLTHPWIGRKTGKNNAGNNFSEIEKFLLDKAPVILATQERFEIFIKENQKHVKNNVKLASIPSGMLGELLYLDYKEAKNFQIIGIDYDISALEAAKKLAITKKLINNVKLIQKNAWHLEIENEFDLISSNGLNIYEPDNNKVTDLYREFYKALKPGGTLVTSFVTYPPGVSETCEWNIDEINENDLLLQRIIFGDIIGAKWQCFRSTEQTKNQLNSAGFKNINFIYDKSKIFPTVVSVK